MLEHLIGAELETVLALKAALEALGDGGVGVKEAAPGA
jgi:hypothetical protein